MAPDPPPTRKRKSEEVIIEDSDDDDDIQVISTSSALKANPKVLSQPIQKRSTQPKPSTTKKGLRSQPTRRQPASRALSQQPSTSAHVVHSSKHSLANGIGSSEHSAALTAFLTQRPSTSTAPPPSLADSDFNSFNMTVLNLSAPFDDKQLEENREFSYGQNVRDQ